MATDDERREVARRLREVEGYAIPDRRFADHPITGEVIAAAVMYDLPDVKGLLGRLADLIEPSEPKVKCVAEVKVDGERLEKLAHDAAVELTGIDREALLALADEMDEVAQRRRSMGYEGFAIGDEDRARRIREALGVES